MSGIPSGAGSLLGKHLGKYEILALLALGGTAEIYLARIAGTNGFEKYVVVKCLHDHLADDQDFVKMFLDEARMAAVLDHSNIVQTFELGEHENRYYMVMEFLAGLSLAMVVRRAGERIPGGKVPTALILNMAAQAAAGLHYAHERQSNGKPLNMVHRDISPQNLVVSFEGVVKVVDFGIARAEYRETKTKAGTIKGKFAYMSPEQCIATDVDRRTDVFALGVIVHELLTGRRLFKRNTPYETYQAVIECVVPTPSSVNHELDPALDAIIMKACAKNKADRYATAEAFCDAMQGYLHHRGKGSGPGEVGRFFEEYFGQEIEEHGERMRELISGRDLSVDTGVNWNDEDEEAKRRANETVDLGGGGEAAVALDSQDVEVVRPSEASLEQLVSRLSTENDAREEGDAPPDRTRIETNPLDKLKELDVAAHTPVPRGSVTNGPAPLPAPPIMPKQPKQVVNAKASGKFPDLAQIPTMIAELDENTPKPSRPHTQGPAQIPTVIAQDATPKPSRTRTPLPEQIPTMIAQDDTPRPRLRTNAPELAPTAAAAPIDPTRGKNPTQPEQAMTDADVARVGPYSQTHDAVRRSELQAAMEQRAADSPYPVVQGGRPFSSDLAPSDMQSRPSQRGFDPQQAVNVMSPVGDHFGQQVDWDAAAARTAKALAPWQLVLLFVGALGVALMVTIVIAKIIR